MVLNCPPYNKIDVSEIRGENTGVVELAAMFQAVAVLRHG
jgi:hypothetical protein